MPGAVNVAIRWRRAGGGASSIAASIGNAVAAGVATSVTPGSNSIATGIGNAVAVGLTVGVNSSGGPTLITAPSIVVWRAA
jgi:hypothetical protein